MTLYKYTQKEASNLLIGQNGFDVIGEHDTTVVNPDTERYCMVTLVVLLIIQILQRYA